jgi:hypothetical protein
MPRFVLINWRDNMNKSDKRVLLTSINLIKNIQRCNHLGGLISKETLIAINDSLDDVKDILNTMKPSQMGEIS